MYEISAWRMEQNIFHKFFSLKHSFLSFPIVLNTFNSKLASLEATLIQNSAHQLTQYWQGKIVELLA